MSDPSLALVNLGFSGRVVEPYGDGSSEIMCVAEAPGQTEDETGIPLHPQAPAGAIFERCVKRAGYSRESFTITNSVWQRPPANELDGYPYETEAYQYWRPHLLELIEQRRPKVILAYGNVALKNLTEYGRGEKNTISYVQNYVLDGPCGSYIIPQLHPSFIIPRVGKSQGHYEMIGVLIWGLQLAHQIVRKGFQRDEIRVITHPTLSDAELWARSYDPAIHTLSYDIETPESSELSEEEVEDQEDEISWEIKRISFCYDAHGYAITFPYQPPFLDLTHRLLRIAQRTRVWNAPFDNTRLVSKGHILNAKCYDSMQFWKFINPTLPRSLGFASPLLGWTNLPWKHENSTEPEKYSAIDSWALQRNGDAIEALLRKQGRWELADRHVRQVYEIAEQMSRNGLPYDKEEAVKFQVKLETMQAEREATLQTRVPDSLKNVSPKLGYKKLPKDTSGMIQRTFTIAPSELTKAEREPLITEWELLPDKVSVTRWCRMEPFLPTSSQQMLALIKHYGYKPGVNRKTKKPTTDADTLKSLIKLGRRTLKGKEFADTLQMSLEVRQLSKVIGTYVKGWQPGKDGRVHAQPSFAGKMFRISWRRPNIGGTIADKQEAYVAEGFRGCVKTSAGRVLLESDYKGFEAKIVGWYANDPEYMRLADIGVHTYMTAIVLADQHRIPQSDVPSLSWSDADIKAALAPLKKKFTFEYDQNKHGTHLSNYLGTPFLMNVMFPESFPRISDAEKWQHLYFSTVAKKVRAWQESVIERADREHKLCNVFGYQMDFWGIRHWDSRNNKWVLGDDAKSAVSFLPRDTAAAMLKEVLLRPSIRQLAEQGILLASVHDSLLTEVGRDDLERVASTTKLEMEKPFPELNGLSVNVEQAYGESWDKEAMELYEPKVIMSPA